MTPAEVFAGCDIYPGKPGIKMRVAGAEKVPATAPGNKYVVNGTGGLVCVDVDPKNGGSIAGFYAAFPECRGLSTLIVATASGVGRHLFYRIPDGFRIRTRLGANQIAPGVDVPHQYLMAGSEVAGRVYSVLVGSAPAEAPASLLAVLDAGSARLMPVEAASAGMSEIVAGLVAQLRNAAPSRRFDAFGKIGIPVIRELGEEQAWTVLSDAYPGDDLSEFRRWFDSACVEAGGAAIRRVNGFSALRDQVTEYLMARCRLGRLPFTTGKAGVVERRLLWRILVLCREANELKVDVWIPELAAGAALYPDQVRDVIERLPVHTAKGGHSPWTISVSPCLDSMGIKVTPLAEKGRGWFLSVEDCPGEVTYTPMDSRHPDPNHPVWDSGGLTGHHSMVLDYVSVGAVSRAELVGKVPVSRAVVYSCVSKLVDHGLVEDVDGTLRVHREIEGNAEVAAEVHGGSAKRGKVAARIARDERKRDELFAAHADAELERRERESHPEWFHRDSFGADPETGLPLWWPDQTHPDPEPASFLEVILLDYDHAPAHPGCSSSCPVLVAPVALEAVPVAFGSPGHPPF